MTISAGTRWEHILGVALDALERDPAAQDQARATLRQLRGVAAVRVETMPAGLLGVWPGIPPRSLPDGSDREGTIAIGLMGDGREVFFGRVRQGALRAVRRWSGIATRLEWWSADGDPQWVQLATNVPDYLVGATCRRLTRWLDELAWDDSAYHDHQAPPRCGGGHETGPGARSRR